MMNWWLFVAFDDRLLRVGIEIDGKVNIYDNLAITGVGAKFASITQNLTVITIANLEKSVRDYLLTEGTPFRRLTNRKRIKIFLEAGRVSYGYVRVFEGDITTVTISQPPDITLTINALTNQHSKGDIVNAGVPTVSSIKQIAAQAAESLGVNFDFQATDKNISNYRYDGSAAGQLSKINDFGGLDVFVDDDTLIVKDKGKPIPGTTRVLNVDTGLVGNPEFTEFGIKVLFLFDGFTGLGSRLKLESEINTAAKGLYSIYRLGFDLANRESPFYLIAEARRIV